MTDRNEYELLTKADVMRQYRYPEHLLEADLRSGAIPYFTANGQRMDPTQFYSSVHTRFYIPRYGVEARIRERANGEGTAA